MSHDPKILFRLQRDRLHHTDMVCIRTIQEIVDAASTMMTKECKNVEYPYLLFGGGGDPLCNPNKWKVFHDNTLSDDKELIVFEGLYHECLNESEPHQKKVCQKLIEWLQQRCQIYQYEQTERLQQKLLSSQQSNGDTKLKTSSSSNTKQSRSKPSGTIMNLLNNDQADK